MSGRGVNRTGADKKAPVSVLFDVIWRDIFIMKCTKYTPILYRWEKAKVHAKNGKRNERGPLRKLFACVEWAFNSVARRHQQHTSLPIQ